MAVNIERIAELMQQLLLELGEDPAREGLQITLPKVSQGASA